MSWDALLLPFADDVLARDVLVIRNRSPEPPACPADEFTRRLLSEVALEQSARAHLTQVASWVGDVPHACAVADVDGIVLYARDGKRDAGTPFFRQGSCVAPESIRSALRAGRSVVFDIEGESWCTLLIPLTRQDRPATGLLLFAAERSSMDSTVAAVVTLAARILAADVDLRHVQAHNDRVFGMIGHELRQPLAALITALDLLGRRSALADKPFGVARRQTVQLMGLVNALLDVSRMMTRKLRLTRRLLDLRRVVLLAVESVRGDIDARRQALDVSVPEKAVWCLADSLRLQQVVVNLLTNAHRYTPPGGRIRVSLEDGETITLAVSDTGPGIPPEMRQRIFQPFVQSSPFTQGLGLGLAISRGITHMHGGRIMVEDVDHGGSRFVVQLPGVLERSREVRNAVIRTRAETRMLVERARMIRSVLEPHRRPGGA